MPCEECYRISIICCLKISVWTGENDFKTLLADAYFFFHKKRRKRIIFLKNIRYIWTGSQTRDAWFYSTGVVKENTAVPQTRPIMICTYPGVPYKTARLIHNWAPLHDKAWSEDEVWRPSGVEHFLSNTKLVGCGDQPDPHRWHVPASKSATQTVILPPRKASAVLHVLSLFFFVANTQGTCH